MSTIRVTLRLVGFYADIPDIEVPQGASVLDVLRAATGQYGNNPDLVAFEYDEEPLADPVTGSGLGQGVSRLMVKFRDSAVVQTRKRYQSGNQRAPLPFMNDGVIEYSDKLTDSEFRTRVCAGEPINAIQYYVFNPPASPTPEDQLGELISDDGVIVSVENTSDDYPLVDGSVVVFRLVGIFFGFTGRKTDVKPGAVSAKLLIATYREAERMKQEGIQKMMRGMGR